MNLDRFKYRYWKYVHKRMLPVFSFNISDDETIFLQIALEDGSCLCPALRGDDRNRLMQCTGMRDKNGKLIYEGDIVKYKNHENNIRYHTIEWERITNCGCCFNVNAFGFDIEECEAWDECEIAGHIFDEVNYEYR